LVLPARHEKKPLFQIRSSLGFTDPRTEEGELLWPDRFGEPELRRLEIALGSYGTAGQLQQRPSPAEGGLIKQKYFKLWPRTKKLPAFDLIIQSYDTAFTDQTQNDPTACTTWGVFSPPRDKDDLEAEIPLPCLMLIDAWHDHLTYPDLRKKARAEYKMHYGEAPGRRPDWILIEKKGSGQSLISDLQRDNLPIRSYNPLSADKTSRVHQSLPTIEAGHVYLLESAKNEGEPVTWASEFLKQCTYFPKGEHDDYVDTMTQVIIYLRDSGWVVTKDRVPVEDPYDEAEAEDRRRKSRSNPYGA
jgi:predicted phage terminase large subunit-like protein